MSWNAPQSWREVTASIEAGWSFTARPLGVQGDNAHAVCGQASTRAVLSGHLDDFAHHIIASNDDLHERYMSGMNRWDAQRDDDATYFVTRDGNALAYVTRAGEVLVNPRLDQTTLRYRNALGHVLPALAAYAAKRIERRVIGVGDEVFTPGGGVAQTVHRVGTDRWFVRFDNADEDAYPTAQLKKVIDF